MTSTLASDLYLNEKWDAYAETEPNADARRARIFAEYIALGANGRWPYWQAAAQLSAPVSFSPEVEATRTPQERALAKVLHTHSVAPWVRTNYAANNLLAGQDEDHMEWATCGSTSEVVRLATLNIESAFGSLDLEAVLQRLPELVDSYCRPQDPAVRASRFEELRSEITSQLELLDDGGDDDDEYEEARNEMLEGVHGSYVTGRFWLQDEVADETHQIRLVWIDEYGRVVRENRVGNLQECSGVLMARRDEDSRWWLAADFGAEYDPIPADYAAMFSETAGVN